MTSATLFPDPDRPAADPHDVLAVWLRDEPAARELMTLSTVDADGRPSSRVLVLSSHDPEGLRFHTDARSDKVRALSGTPAATASFLWADRARHLVVRGRVRAESAADAAQAFARRPLGLKVLAWLNDDDFAALPMPERRARWARQESAAQTRSVPPTWTGYVLVPDEITFWQGTAGAGSVRVRYRREPGAQTAWHVRVLPG
ncbi:MAG: pyridoxamine 5'-phosphate oxidase family protein [Microbacterium sp.]